MTRVIFIPQGEFVACEALTLITIQVGGIPATVWLLLGEGVLAAAIVGMAALRAGQSGHLLRLVGWHVDYPLALVGLLFALPLKDSPMLVQNFFALAVVVPMGPLMYRRSISRSLPHRC